MDDKPKKVIIIKRVNKGHGGHHGGSWKVAYADFVTAMMAFFLVMWLLSMVSPEKRAVMAQYFKNFSLFEHGGKSFMQEGGFKAIQQSGGAEYYETGEESISGFTEEEMKGQLLSAIQQDFQGLKGSVIIETSDLGVKVQVVDKQEFPIFLPGSTQLTEEGKRVLKLVAATMKNLPNKIIVEGHTDSVSPKNEQMSNWELSALRACTARKELEADGIGQDRIARVVGYANKEPLFRNNLEDSRNRRISIVFLYSKKKIKSANPYGWVWKTPPVN